MASSGRRRLCLFPLFFVLQISILFLVLMPSFLPFCAFLLVILLFKMALKCGAEVLFSFPRCKKAMTCLMENVF